MVTVCGNWSAITKFKYKILMNNIFTF